MSGHTMSGVKETGIPAIDRQHERWMNLYRQLSDAVDSGQAKEAVHNVLDELLDYSVAHFRLEERLMTEHGYPEVEAHRAAHQDFRRQINTFRGRHELGHTAKGREVLDFMGRWLVEHISGTDQDYVPTLRAGLAR